MFKQKDETPIATDERTGLVERRTSVAPGQKLVMVATALAASLAILYGIASKNDFFGIFGPTAKPKTEKQEESRPVDVPQLNVPLGVATKPAPSSYVECQGGLRLPIGMTCPSPKAEEPSKEATKPDAPASAPAGPTLEERLAERRRKGDIALSAVQTVRPVDQRTAGQGLQPVGLAGASTPQGGSNALASALSGTITPGTSAGLISNPSLTLAKGTLPDCVLLTAIRTDQPGFLKCMLSKPVMSMDNKVVLMEAGSTMEGEYTQGVLVGQQSIFTLWTRAVTPHFVTIPLNSPGTDQLGRAGTSGFVDNKWFERFAGAVIFSLFQDAKQIVIADSDRRAARASSNTTGNTFNIGGQGQGTLSQFGNTDSTTNSIVQEMLKQGSQIKPTLEKNQGDIIKIYVARDVDFSTVYELQPAGN